MNHKPFITNGIVIIIFILIFAFFYDKHFGNNLAPQIIREAIFDLMAFIGMLTGITFITIGQAIRNKK